MLNDYNILNNTTFLLSYIFLKKEGEEIFLLIWLYNKVIGNKKTSIRLETSNSKDGDKVLANYTKSLNLALQKVVKCPLQSEVIWSQT